MIEMIGLILLSLNVGAGFANCFSMSIAGVQKAGSWYFVFPFFEAAVRVADSF